MVQYNLIADLHKEGLVVVHIAKNSIDMVLPLALIVLEDIFMVSLLERDLAGFQVLTHMLLTSQEV